MKKVLPAIFLSFLISAFLFILPSSAQAQDCGVEGNITSPSGEALKGVLVAVHELKLDSTKIFLKSTRTDDSGFYRISGLPCGVELILFVVCTGPEDPGHRFTIPSGTITINREMDCITGPGPGPGPAPYPSIDFLCDLSKGERVSRPDECELCNQTYLFCPACATSFTIHDKVKYVREDVDYWCPGPDGDPWLRKRWGGDITIDISDVSIPFVGKTGEENEENYLADYFEGTHEYYRDYPLYWLQGVNYAGVLRKLTPMEYQNQLKKEMVNRAVSAIPGNEEAIHNYQLNYRGRICWDLPFWADAFLALLQRYESKIPSPLRRPLKAITTRTHYCLFEGNLLESFGVATIERAIRAFNGISPIKISYWRETDVPTWAERRLGKKYYLSNLAGHEPPKPDEEDYVKKWNEWKESGGRRWSKLWQVAPIVSREDTPGWIMPYLGYQEKDTVTPSFGDDPKSIPPEVEKVPHVARLYEASQEVKNMLMPYQGSGGVGQKEKEPIIASAKTLLAQTDSVCGLPDPQAVPRCDQPAITDSNPNDTLCCGEIKTNLSAEDHFVNPVYEECIYSCDCCEAPEPPVQRCPPGDEGQPGQDCDNLNKCDIAGGCNPACCATDADCPSGQPCNISNGYCRSGLSCNPTTSSTQSVLAVYINSSCAAPCLCNPSCKDEFTQPVSRNFGINLLHPYLTQIWEQTSRTDTSGLFNFFRPKEVPEFIDIDAADEISYRYQDTSDPDGGYLTPETGLFYFNHLGGVQLAKDWLVRALWPFK